MKRPKIVLTNDDGIHAPGIKCLWKALHEADFADLYIVAPSGERSGTGVSITWNRPLLIQKMEWPKNTPAWSVSGTPADCIKMGERVILGWKPDFIVSGINAGSNAGRNVLHSGTIGACIEGAFRGIPSIALSCENGDQPNFHVAEKYVVELVQYAMQHPCPAGSLLNVNFPHAAQEEVEGFRLTSQGKGRWAENPYLHHDTEEGLSYWLGGQTEELQEDPDCDIAWLKKGYITATPLYVLELTDRRELNLKQEKFENFFAKKEVVGKVGVQ